MKNKKVLVTGGAGFIGSNLVKRLIEDGNSVTVLDNFISGYRSNLEPFSSIHIIEGDIRDISSVEEAMHGVEVVFHLAASVGNKRSIDHPLIDAEINVLGTLQMLEAARKEGVQKIVTSSSAGIFGEVLKRYVLDILTYTGRISVLILMGMLFRFLYFVCFVMNLSKSMVMENKREILSM
jgi:nucleoside-diphosphate-sugar epimerase